MLGDPAFRPTRSRGVNDIGSLSWAESTQGRLSRAQVRQVRLAVLREVVRLARSHLLLRLGRGRRCAATSLDVLEVPGTALGREVAQMAAAGQSGTMLAHALRSLAFAHALASLDGVTVDPELLWCACLLHDVALEHPVPNVCFAVRGARIAREAAERAAVSRQVADALADAIVRHLTPGLDPNRHPLPALLAAGALVDVLGLRLDDLQPDFIRAVLTAQPRDGFAHTIADAWRAEAHAVPRGRAAVAEQTACFSLAARWAPLPTVP